MRPLRTFKVEPSLPDELSGLILMAFNLRWSWHGETRELFRRLDSRLWETTAHNPVAMLGQIDQDRLNTVVKDSGFMAQYRRVYNELRDHLSKGGWWFDSYGAAPNPKVAYFCAEFGLTECLPIYSGGLGVLAGDHLKSRLGTGHAAGGRRPAVPAGLLPPVPQRRRLAAGAFPAQRFPQHAGAAGDAQPTASR